MILQALVPPGVQTAKIRQAAPGEHHTIALKQGSRKIYLVCHDATVGEVRLYYADQVGATGVDGLEVAITLSRGRGTKTYGPSKATSLPVTPDMTVIEFRAPAPAKG